MQQNNKPQSMAGYIFECTMAILYLAIAYTLLLTSIFDEAIANANIRIGLGILLAVYGLFRIFRAIRKGLARK